MDIDTAERRGTGTNHGQDNHKPLIPNEGVVDIRFDVPKRSEYPVRTSILSILSLLLLSGFSIVMYLQLTHPENNLIAGLQRTAGTGLWSAIVDLLRPPPANSVIATWAWLPFLFTGIGGTLGWIFELGLLLAGIPFQQNRSRFTVFIQKLRFLNLAPVITTILFFVCAMVIQDPSLRMALLFLAGAGCFGLAAGLYFGGAPALPLVVLGTQAAQLVLVLASGAPVGSTWIVIMLAVQAGVQGAAFLVGTKTPLRSTAFHVLSSLSGVLLYGAIVVATEADGGFSQRVAPVVPGGSLLMWGLVVACIAGLVFTMKVSPMTYNTWRCGASNAVWSVVNFILISAKRFPKPLNLSEVYKDGAPPKAELQPYYQQHPEFLPQMLSVPALRRIEGSLTAFGDKVTEVRKIFKLIALIDHVFPQADVKTPVTQKPRMKIWSDGEDVYPQLFLRTIFGFSLPVPPIKKTPPPVIEAFKKGQLLAYLGESGVANPFLKPAPERGEGALKMDFRFLEKYETKPDYESYGGVAYFRLNERTEALELESVVAPHSDEELAVNPMDSSFRHAESMVTASMYFHVITGKHLGQIHMTYNLLETVLHNAFDAQGQFAHPVRTFMYLHLFSHELAEELTTGHLVQEGAVFSQIFATTHDGLINHLNDCYRSFNYGEDEDFEARKAAMTMSNGKTLPKACINWELEYVAIWRRYTDALMDIIYEDDAAVQNDSYLQDVHRGLLQVMLNGLPDRYDRFQTKSGVSRWASDTIHHLVVRHQVYGTTGVRASMDPRIGSSQIPTDRGTPAVDEWRSFLGVGLATACSRFTLLVGEDGETFTYLLEGVSEDYRSSMAVVFEQLQEDLLELDRGWTADAIQKEYNYNYFRTAPSALRTGPGY